MNNNLFRGKSEQIKPPVQTESKEQKVNDDIIKSDSSWLKDKMNIPNKPKTIKKKKKSKRHH